METFSALLVICAGNSPVTGEFPTQRPVTRSFDVFFDLGPNKRLSKQSWGWWFETQSRPLWRHRNEMHIHVCAMITPLSLNLWLLDVMPWWRVLMTFADSPNKLLHKKWSCRWFEVSVTVMTYLYIEYSEKMGQDSRTHSPGMVLFICIPCVSCKACYYIKYRKLLLRQPVTWSSRGLPISTSVPPFRIIFSHAFL